MVKKFFLFGMIVLWILIIFGVGVYAVVPNPGHSADEILVEINQKSMTLQEAFDGNFLKDSVALPTLDNTTSLTKYHLGNNLQIYLGERLSLQDAINKIGGATSIANKGFCKDTPGIFSWIFSFIGHSADQITFSDGETLQQKINTQKFCSYKWKAGAWSSCPDNFCNEITLTRNVICERSDGGVMIGNDEDFCSAERPDDRDDSGQYCYGWKDDGWQGCVDACGDCEQTRSVWCARCDNPNSVLTDESNCTLSTKPDDKWTHDFGDTICGWSDDWTTTSICSYTGSCGGGHYKRTRTCDVPGHCAGNDYDWNGAECFVGSTDCHCAYYEYCVADRKFRDYYACVATFDRYGCDCKSDSWIDHSCVVPLPPPPVLCFVSNTQITMSDGTTKNIEDVMVGEFIKTVNFRTMEIENKPVLELSSSMHSEMVRLEFKNAENKNTFDHPYFVQGKGLASYNPYLTRQKYGLEVSFLEEGDIVFRINEDNELIEEKLLSITEEIGKVQTYNLMNVKDNHNFFANGILVHNKKVLCTEAYKQGYLSEELYNADVEYAKKYVDEATLIGYHSWAKPLVRVMKTSPKIFTNAMPLSVEWGKHMAYVMDYSQEDSQIGEVLANVGMLFCNELGILLMEQGYSKDNEYEFEDKFIEELFLKYIDKGTFSKDKLSGLKAEKYLKNDLENFFFEIKEFYENNNPVYSDSFLQKYL